MALRNKSFGSAQEFVWAADSSEYAVRENASTVKLFKNFKEKKTFKPDFGAEQIFGGFMLGVKSPSGNVICHIFKCCCKMSRGKPR
jgi:coatomer subunit beta'